MNVNALYGDFDAKKEESNYDICHIKDIDFSPPTTFSVSNSRQSLLQDVNSNSYFPAHHKYNFRAYPDTLKLHGQHDYGYGYIQSVAMSYNYFNVRSNENEIVLYLRYDHTLSGGAPTRQEMCPIKITPGKYTDINELIGAIKTAFAAAKLGRTAAMGATSYFDYVTELDIKLETNTYSGIEYNTNHLTLELKTSGLPANSNLSWTLATREYEYFKLKHLVDIEKILGISAYYYPDVAPIPFIFKDVSIATDAGNSLINTGEYVFFALDAYPAGVVVESFNAGPDYAYQSDQPVNVHHIRSVKIHTSMMTNSFGGSTCVVSHDNVVTGHMQIFNLSDPQERAFQLNEKDIQHNGINIRVTDIDNVPLEGYGDMTITFGLYGVKKTTQAQKRQRIM